MRPTLPTIALSSAAVAADHLAALFGGELAAVVHQEARAAGELVRLLRDDLDGQFLVREIGSGQLEVLGSFGLILVDLARALLVTTRFQLLDRVLGMLVLGLA